MLLIPPRAHSNHNDFTSGLRGTRRSRQGSPGAAVSGTGPQISAPSGSPGCYGRLYCLLCKNAFFGSRVPDPTFRPGAGHQDCYGRLYCLLCKNAFFGPRVPDPTFRHGAGRQDCYGPKMAQNGPKTAPKMAQDGPKKAPRWPKTAPRKCHE